MTLENLFGDLALDDTLTDGTQRTIIVDGGNAEVSFASSSQIDTANLYLGNIDSNTHPPGQATMNNSSPVVIASDQTTVPVVDSALATLIGTSNTALSEIDTKTPALGQALAANSTPVVLTAIQQSALTPPAAITGFATSSKQDTAQTALDAIKTDVDKIPAQGQALAANSTPVVLTAIQQAALTPPAAITGFATSSKQDTAQTALDAIKTDVDKIPSLGQALAAASVPVVLTAAQLSTLTPVSAVTADTELTLSDLDTGAGTDNRAVTGMVLAESGGGQLVGSAHPMPVSGTVAVTNADLTTIASAIKAEDVASNNGDPGIVNMFIQKATPADTAADGDYVVPQQSGGRQWVSTIVTDVVTGVGATNLGKAEDAVHTSGDVGVMALGIQKATPADLAADGDYAPIQVSAGRQWASSIITDIVPGVAATSLGKREDDAHNTLDTGVLMLAVRTDVSTQRAGTDGDYSVLETDSRGQLHVAMPKAATSTDVSLASSNITAQVIAANTARVGMYLTNTDANDVYIYFGTTATASKFSVRLGYLDTLIMPGPIYTGRIDAIWAADGSGSLIGTELAN